MCPVVVRLADDRLRPITVTTGWTGLQRIRPLSSALERYQEVTKARPRPKKGAGYEIGVLGEVHPEIEVEKFVKILLNYERRDPWALRRFLTPFLLSR